MKITMTETNLDRWAGRVRDALAGIGFAACVVLTGYAVEFLR